MQHDNTNPIMLEESLKNKAVKGTFWIFTSRIATQFLSLIKNIIIARILSPDDFGLFGFSLIALSLFEVFSRTGFGAALIQKKEDIKEYLDTAFVVNILRGGILFLLLFLSAPLVSLFFDNKAVIPIVRIIGFTFLINGFINPGIIYFTKELDFKKQFYWEASQTITDIIVVLSIIFLLRNVWVLVIASISSYLVRMVVSYLLHSFRPKFYFRKQYASSLFKFGKWILASSILVYLITEGDDILVGKFLGVTMLGFYKMAYRFSNLPATQITHVVSIVSFPLYSKLQDNIPKLREAYLKVLQVTTFLSFPIAGLIFVLAPDFTEIFLGEKWMPMVPALQVLAFFGAIRSISATCGSLFQGAGYPKFIYKVSLIKLCCLIPIIYPLTIRLGIIGTALAVTVPSIFTLAYAISLTLRIIKCQTYVFLKLLFYPMIGTIIMSGTLLSFQSMLIGEMILFILNILLGLFIYIGFLFMIDRIFKDYELLKNLSILFNYRNIIKSKKKK